MSAIKLFGKTILFPSEIKTLCDYTVSGEFEEKSLGFSSCASTEESKKADESGLTKESALANPTEERSRGTSPSSKDSKVPFSDTKSVLEENFSRNSELSETISEKTRKRPEKIISCPRCKSENTKFCYYNNYNLTQPRHFCKDCQRYWTSGGTMRNVPVGSGRRKSKSGFLPNFPQLASQAYGEFLEFGSNPQAITPRESFVLESNFGAKIKKCGSPCPSSVSSSDSVEKVGKDDIVIQESVWNNFQNCSPLMFYQAPTYLSFPCIYPQNGNSQLLGKHLREGQVFSNSEENNFWSPKASRIGDTSEAKKSSMWSALGIKNNKGEVRKRKGIFKAFESNENEENFIKNKFLVLQANPAALARSLNFQENA